MLAALELEGLPNREAFEKPVHDALKAQLPALAAAFVYYCKTSSECVTLEQATRLPLAGAKKLSQTLGLESAVLPIENIVRIFGKSANGGEMPATAKEVPSSTALDLRGFLSFMVQVGFYRQNPRHGALGAVGGKEKSGASENANVAAAVKVFLGEVGPKLPKPSQSFSKMLAGDRQAQQVLTQYASQLESWRAATLSSESSDELYAAFIASMEKTGVIGTSTITDAKEGGFGSKEVSLTALAARHALLEAHEPTSVALGKLSMDMEAITRAVAQCGDKKLDPIEGLPLAWRVRAVVQALVGELELGAAASEALASSPTIQTSNASAEEIEAAQQAAIKKSWRLCWKMMVFKDLVGYPLWETQLHDVLQVRLLSLPRLLSFPHAFSLSPTPPLSHTPSPSPTPPLPHTCSLAHASSPTPLLSHTPPLTLPLSPALTLPPLSAPRCRRPSPTCTRSSPTTAATRSRARPRSPRPPRSASWSSSPSPRTRRSATRSTRRRTLPRSSSWRTRRP